jgi:N-acetylmuramoyl-L-alanine amidase
MKFGIDIGHNCPPDTGATGIEQEDKLTLAVGEVVINNLKILILKK